MDTYLIICMEKYVNAVIVGVGMLLSPRALKSHNSIVEIQPRMKVFTFNGNPSKMLISYYSPTNASDENDLTPPITSTPPLSVASPNTAFKTSKDK